MRFCCSFAPLPCNAVWPFCRQWSFNGWAIDNFAVYLKQHSYWTWKTWKIRHFYKKSGKIWNSQGTFYNIYPSQGKVREKVFSLHIIFINYWHSPQSRCSNCCQWMWTLSFSSMKYQIYLRYLSARLHSFASFCKYVKWGSGKKWLFLTTSQGKVRE